MGPPSVRDVRFLHTSDWHLGRGFHGAGLLDAQVEYLEHLVQVVESERVDAVLVSGDIYDRAMPAPATVAVLDEALARLRSAGARVVISSGNHDSATRLGFAGRVLDEAGVHIRTSIADLATPVEINGVAIYPIPYLEPSVVAPALQASAPTHADVLRAAMVRIRADLEGRGMPGVVMAHAFVTGATTSDSERDISVGGVSAVPRAVFDGVDYAALGHIHRPMAVGSRQRYSGSPVAMSFSEAGQVKSSVLVTVQGGQVSQDLIEAPVHRPIARVRGTLADLLSDGELSAYEDAWCEVTLTDATRPLGAMEQLRRRFPHTLVLRFDHPTVDLPSRSYADRVRGRDDVDLCCDFTEHVRGGATATDAERALWATAFERGRVQHAERDDEGTAGVA